MHGGGRYNHQKLEAALARAGGDVSVHGGKNSMFASRHQQRDVPPGGALEDQSIGFISVPGVH